MAYELATAYVNVTSSAKGAGQSLIKELSASGDTAGAAAGANASKSLSGALTAGVAGFAAKAALGTAAVGAVAIGVGKALYGVGSIFDEVSDTIRVGTGASGAALDALNASAKRVGTQVPADYSKVGTVVADLNTRLGLTGDTLETVSSQYLEAGRILGQDVDIQKTTAAFSAFGIEGAAVEGAMDSLFRVSQATGVGMNQLAGVTQSAAPAMKALGFSFEETAALAGTLDKAGLNSQQVMSGMSRALVNLAKSGEEPQAAFQRVASEIQGFISTGDKAAAIDLASKVFGTRGAPQFVDALQSGKVNLQDITAAAGMTGDTILGLGKETSDAAEKWQILKNRGLAALEPIGSAVFSLTGMALGGLIDSLDWAQGAISRVDFSPILSGLVQVGGPVVSAFRQVFEALAPVFASLVPQILQLWQSLSPVSLLFQVLTPVLPLVTDAIAQLVAGLAPLVGIVAEVAQQIASALIPVFSSVVPILVQLAQVAIVPLVGILSAVLIPAIQALLPVVQVVFGAVASVISSVMQIVQGVIQVVTGVISGNWSQVWSGIQNIFGGIWNTIVNLVRGAINIVSSVIRSVIGGISGFIGGALGNIGNFFANVWRGIVSNTQNMIGSLIGFFTSLPGRILGVLSGAGQWLVGVGRNMIQGLLNGIQSLAGTIGNFFLSLLPDWIVGPFKAALGIASPSKLFRLFGVNIGQGLILGMDDMEGSIEQRTASLVALPSTRSYTPAGATTGTGGGPLVQQTIQVTEGMSAETVGAVAAGRINAELRGLVA